MAFMQPRARSLSFLPSPFLRSFLLSFLVSGLAAGPAAAAGSVPAALQVSAEVRPSAVFRFESMRSQIEVSRADVERGYVEIAEGSLLKLDAGQIRPTVVADFSPEAGPFKSIAMSTDSGWLAARADSGSRLQPGNLNDLPPTGAIRGQAPALPSDPSFVGVADSSASPHGVTAALSYRFNLSDDAGPGTYRLPLTLNISL